MSARGIRGSYLFEDERGRAITVTSERYVAMIEEFFYIIVAKFSGLQYADPVSTGWSDGPYP